MIQPLPVPLLRVQFTEWSVPKNSYVNVTGLVVAWLPYALASSPETKALAIVLGDDKQVRTMPANNLTAIGWRREIQIT